MRISTLKAGKPCFILRSSSASPSRCATSGFRAHSEPIGLISVMPQACRTVTPYFVSNASVMARGQAEPPMTTRSRVESGPPVALKVLEQRQPDGRHGGRERDALPFQELVDRRSVELRRPAAPEPRPAIGAENARTSRWRGTAARPASPRRGDDRPKKSALCHGDSARSDVGTMRVEHALGLARRARGVAKAGGGVLVEGGPGEIARPPRRSSPRRRRRSSGSSPACGPHRSARRSARSWASAAPISPRAARRSGRERAAGPRRG